LKSRIAIPAVGAEGGPASVGGGAGRPGGLGRSGRREHRLPGVAGRGSWPRRAPCRGPSPPARCGTGFRGCARGAAPRPGRRASPAGTFSSSASTSWIPGST
jgi:hypothetical protein